MTNEEIAVKLTDHEQEIKSLKHRMNKQEESTVILNKISVSIEKMSLNMEYMAKEQVSQGKRLETLEREPSENYKTIKNTIIGCVVSGIIGALLGAVFSIIFK